jgi:ferrous iron transport protein B
MPRRTAKVDDALDRWLLHPVVGLLSLAVVMFPDLPGRLRVGHAAEGTDRCRYCRARRLGWRRLAAGTTQQPDRQRYHRRRGGVIVFLPQILILFAFILALEESGYLPRAASCWTS